ncbi:hypothetical protein GGR56DRAFT_670802 [Xylariaceae sp. FL0804]|nr:hypothetical protein GGR56DRAFT_670802 [Xylariaceae sp. FL0804]
MSPFPTAHCCRVVRTHLRPQCDSIWIPDALLYSAFERFRATAPAAARHASSVPGPMESRRRVGKRHMGELNLGQPHAAAPLWALENLVDLSQWTWKPPKTPEVLSRRDTASHYPARGLAGLAENAAETTLPVDVLLPEDTVLAGVAELMPAEEESLVEEASAEEARDAYLYQSLEDGDLYCCKELAAKLWDSEQYSQFTDLMQFLQHLGREHSVMEVVRGARRTGTNVVRTLANAVIGIGKPSLAVRVLYLWIESIEHPRGFWDSPFGAEAMTLLMDAPTGGVGVG